MESRRQTIIAPPPALLEFRFASFAAGDDGRPPLEKVNITLRTGELMLVWHDPGTRGSVLADAAAGLIAPARGSVWFLGNDWGKTAGRAAVKLRASIGRVHRDAAWEGAKRVKEAVRQRVRHHPWGSRKALSAEAEALARRLGLNGLPADRGPDLPPPIQRIACWVRALAGRPELLILEWPLAGAPTGCTDSFFRELATARARGAAILWLTDADELPAPPDLAVSQQFDVADSTLRPR